MAVIASEGRTIDAHELPLWVRALNAAGRGLQRVGVRPSLDERALFAAAESKTGLHDFGSDEFREPLRALIDSYEAEGDLTLFGRIGVREDLIRSLSNRLRVEADVARHPEILEIPVRKPLFIVGLPRTGTTLLLNLLSQDPGARIPRLYELMSPWTPAPSRRGKDERIAAAERVMKLYFGLLPEMRTIHPQHPMAPDECTFLLQQSFVSLDASARASVRGYVDYLLRRDLGPDYRYYRKQLQLLQSHEAGDHWVLKSPVHLLALGPLLDAFPDASIVQTHRAPREVIPSLCSLTALMRELFVETRDAERVGEDILSWWSELLDRALVARERADEGRFFDVDYGDLLEDPVGVVRGMYAHFGYDFSPELKGRIERWLKENPQDKHGVHRYSAEQFGLTTEAIDRRFAGYMARFGLGEQAPLQNTPGMIL